MYCTLQIIYNLFHITIRTFIWLIYFCIMVYTCNAMSFVDESLSLWLSQQHSWHYCTVECRDIHDCTTCIIILANHRFIVIGAYAWKRSLNIEPEMKRYHSCAETVLKKRECECECVWWRPSGGNRSSVSGQLL